MRTTHCYFKNKSYLFASLFGGQFNGIWLCHGDLSPQVRKQIFLMDMFFPTFFFFCRYNTKEVTGNNGFKITAEPLDVNSVDEDPALEVCATYTGNKVNINNSRFSC